MISRTLRILLAALALALPAQVAGAGERAAMTVATYNLRLDLAQDGPNAWPNRREMVRSLVRRHGLDVFGTQEGLPGQIDDLAAMGEYAFVGAGRDDGRRAGEHSAIFYRRDRFDLLGAGDFWLSQTPDRPSKGWDARCCNRIASWARLRDRATGTAFHFFSVHFDHEGVVARRESAKLMVRRIGEIAGGEPVVCAGDFNSTPDTEQIRTMRTLLADSFRATATPARGPVGTFNGFKPDAAPTDRIDYVFVSAQVRVLEYAVPADSRDGRYPSDHFPVVVKVEIGP